MFDDPRSYMHVAGDMNGSIEMHEQALETLLEGYHLDKRDATGSVAIDVEIRGWHRSGHRYAALIFLEEGPRGTSFMATSFPDALEQAVLLDYFTMHDANYHKHVQSISPNDS